MGLVDVQKCCPMKVFDLKSRKGKVINEVVDGIDIEDIGQLEKALDGQDGIEVEASRLRDCTYCRECIRLPKREKVVELMKDKTHFTF